MDSTKLSQSECSSSIGPRVRAAASGIRPLAVFDGLTSTCSPGWNRRASRASTPRARPGSRRPPPRLIPARIDSARGSFSARQPPGESRQEASRVEPQNAVCQTKLSGEGSPSIAVSAVRGISARASPASCQRWSRNGAAEISSRAARRNRACPAPGSRSCRNQLGSRRSNPSSETTDITDPPTRLRARAS